MPLFGIDGMQSTLHRKVYWNPTSGDFDLGSPSDWKYESIRGPGSVFQWFGDKTGITDALNLDGLTEEVKRWGPDVYDFFAEWFDGPHDYNFGGDLTSEELATAAMMNPTRDNPMLSRIEGNTENAYRQAGYNEAAQAQAGVRARNQGWASLFEQSDDWTRRLQELAASVGINAQGIGNVDPGMAALGAALPGLGQAAGVYASSQNSGVPAANPNNDIVR